MKTNLYFLLFFIFTLPLSNAQSPEENKLKILNPQWGWWGEEENGMIKDAVFTIEPQGLYMEVGMYLTFSAEYTGYSESDTLEAVLNFNLPTGSIVHDSWLWMSDTVVVRADIWEAGLATEVYEGIVDRNQDPSVLYKKTTGDYELRVFPIITNYDRRIKVTYLVPAKFTETDVESILPLEILSTSILPVNDIRIITWETAQWQNPRLKYYDQNFEPVFDPFFGNHLEIVIPTNEFMSSEQTSSLAFSVDSPMENGVFLSQHTTTNDKYYQFAWIPSSLEELESTPQNVMIIFQLDLDQEDNSSITEIELFDYLKEAMKTHMDEVDHFNVMFHYAGDTGPTLLSPSWISCDEESINYWIDILMNTSFGDFSSLGSMLVYANQVIENSGSEAEILVLSEDNHYVSFSLTNDFMDSFGSQLSTDIPINICNFQNQNYNYSSLGNTKLYTKLAELTNGEYFNLFSWSTLPQNLNSYFSSRNVIDGEIDIHATLDNGICFDPYNLDSSTGNVSTASAIKQVGKMFGDFPFHIEFSCIQDETLFSYEIEIDESMISIADTTVEEMWVGNYLKYNESNFSSPAIIENVIDMSLEHRVLSLHTAFIALEPSLGGEICPECIGNYDEFWPLSTEDVSPIKEIDISISPNPFLEQVNITLQIPKELNADELLMQVFDANGRLVKTLDQFDTSKISEELLVEWNARNQHGQSIAPGVYYLIIQTPKERITRKLICIK